MTEPTDVPSSTSNAVMPTPGGLPIRRDANKPPTTTANFLNSRVTGSRPLPPTPLPDIPNIRANGPRPLPLRPLPPIPQIGPQNSNDTGLRPQPAMATQPRSTTNDGNLRVFRDPKVLTQFHTFPLVKEFQQVSPTDPLFLAVSHCIDTSLRVLEQPRGRQGLIEGGKTFIRLKESAAYKGNLENDEEMGEWVDCFLNRVREDFPNVFVTATLIENAALVRKVRPANVEKDFKPKFAGIMCLDKWVSKRFSQLYRVELLIILTR
jgi:hypothetical protein